MLWRVFPPNSVLGFVYSLLVQGFDLTLVFSRADYYSLGLVILLIFVDLLDLAYVACI